MNEATRVVHAGSEPEPLKSLTPPLYQSSVYYAHTVAEAIALEDPTRAVSSYSRTANPTTVHFERAIAELEEGEAAVATPSGMAAFTLIFLTLLGPRDRVAISPHSYADTVALLEEFAARVGFELLIGQFDPAELVARRVTMVVVESPSNPMLQTTDIAALAQALRPTGAILVVDSTMATPVNQRPLTLGADLVVHSASKYLTGHHNAIAGVIAGGAELTGRLRHMRTISGLSLDPHSAWLVLQGLQTLSLRVRAQNATGAKVAAFLAEHPATDFAVYPGYGGVVTFGLRGDLVSFLESLSLCTIAVSLGGTKTLIEAPTLMSHVQGGPENATLSVIPPNAVRLSVGLEAAEDIIADLAQALSQQEFLRAAQEVIAKVLGLEQVQPSAKVHADLGIDSLTGTYIVARLMTEHGLRVPLPVLLESGTVLDFARRAGEERAGS